MRILRPGRGSPTTARAHNLSPTGVFVESQIRFDVGTDILCDLPLPGGPRLIKGKVARTQPLSLERVGLGIRFIDLEDDERAVLERMVRESADETSHLVKVRFEGLGAPLRSRAQVTPEGIRLSTALPFLRLFSKVGVSFIAGGSRVESQGILHRVKLDPSSSDGVPRLAVDLALPDRDQNHDAAAEPAELDEIEADTTEIRGPMDGAPAVVPELAPVQGHGQADDTRRGRPPREEEPAAAVPQRVAPRDRSSRRRTNAPEQRPTSEPRATRAVHETREPPAREPGWKEALGVYGEGIPPTDAAPPGGPRRTRPDRAALLLRLGAAMGFGFLATLAALHHVSLGRIERRLDELVPRLATSTAPSAPVPAPPTPQVAPPGAAEQATPSVPAPAGAPPVPPPTPAGPELAARTKGMPPPLAPDAPGPVVVRDGAEASATVSIRGSLEGARPYVINEPLTLAVTLPHATTELAPGYYWTRRDGFRVVWIRALEGGGVQLRFVLTFPPPTLPKMDLLPDAVRVRVTLTDAADLPTTVR